MKTAIDETTQVKFWDSWNTAHREQGVDDQEVSRRQSAIVLSWLSEHNQHNLDILEVGCGACWFAPHLMRYGRYVGTDLSGDVLARAAKRWPAARFVPGDFASIDFGIETFDTIITLEVLSHVVDQAGFIAKMARHLKPGGTLMLATQNRAALARCAIPPPAPGQLRSWVDRTEISALLTPHFDINDLFSVTPTFNRGPLHLRLINSTKLHTAIKAVAPALSTAVIRWQEERDLGWTLMVRATKRNA